MSKTLMSAEIAEIPDVIARQISNGFNDYFQTGQMLAGLNGPMATNARGTSDHAVSYFKTMVESRIGKPVSSIPPSVSSVYHSQMNFENGSLLSVSQSGGSTDLIANQNMIANGGAKTVALVNTIDSPLAADADIALDLHAGPEKAVAATKTFAASLFAEAVIVAGMANDISFFESASSLPETLLGQDFNGDQAIDTLMSSQSVFTISRGSGLSLAAEAALKLKETCLIHAECYSAAEVVHGPMVLARKNIVVLAFMTNDEGNKSIVDAIALMKSNGAKVIEIPALINSPSQIANMIWQTSAFYQVAEQLSLMLGQNPDVPPMLNKVTMTV